MLRAAVGLRVWKITAAATQTPNINQNKTKQTNTYTHTTTPAVTSRAAPGSALAAGTEKVSAGERSGSQVSLEIVTNVQNNAGA